MSLTLKQEEKKEYKIVEAGNHTARCIHLIDLGTQEEIKFGTDDKILRHKVRIVWEFPNETITYIDEKTEKEVTRPLTIAKTYTATLNEKSNLYKDLVSWRGKEFTPDELNGFELSNIVDKPCLINIVHVKKDEKTYANISSITPLMKSMVCPDMISEKLIFDLDKFDENTFTRISEYFQNIIMESQEMKNREDETYEDETYDGEELMK